MYKSALLLLALVLATCSGSWALTFAEQVAYEDAMARAIGNITMAVLDNGDRLYGGDISAQEFMRGWDLAIQSPPREATGTRLLNGWREDSEAKQAGFSEGFQANFKTGDGTDFSITVMTMPQMKGCFYLYFWSKQDTLKSKPVASQGAVSAPELPVVRIREKLTGIPQPDVTSAINVSLDSRRIVVGSTTGQLVVFDAVTGEALAGWQGHDKPASSTRDFDDGVSTAIYTPDGRRVVSTSAGRQVRSWEAGGRALSGFTLGGEGMMLSSALHPGGQLLAVAGMALEEGCGEYDLGTGRLVRRYVDSAYSAAYDATGSRLAFMTGLEKPSRIRVFNTRTGELVSEFPVPEGRPLSPLHFSPDGTLLSTVLGDGVVATCSLVDNRLLYAKKPGGASATCVAYMPGGNLLMAAVEGHDVLALNPGTGEPQCRISTDYPMLPMAISPDGALLTNGYAIVTGEKGGLAAALDQALGRVPGPAAASSGGSKAGSGARGAIVVNGVALVPLRQIAEWVGATVSFESAKGRIVLAKGDCTVSLKLGSREALIGGRQYSLSVAAMEHGGTTYVPLRLVADGFNAEVQWEQGATEVRITHPESGTVLALPLS